MVHYLGIPVENLSRETASSYLNCCCQTSELVSVSGELINPVHVPKLLLAVLRSVIQVFHY